MELSCNLCDYDKEKSKDRLKNCSDRVNTYLKIIYQKVIISNEIASASKSRCLFATT